MNALATVIACYSLFANSSAGVIGAMVVAMLLGPIAGVALGLNDGDRLLWGALFSLTLGIAIDVQAPKASAPSSAIMPILVVRIADSLGRNPREPQGRAGNGSRILPLQPPAKGLPATWTRMRQSPEPG